MSESIEAAEPVQFDREALRVAAEACWGAIQKARYTAPDATAPWGFWAATRQTYQLAMDDPRVVLALLDRLAALETALLKRVPMRNHGSAIVCGCCDGALALEQVGPGCCEMTGIHEAGCAAAELITADMARAALGREEANRE